VPPVAPVVEMIPETVTAAPSGEGFGEEEIVGSGRAQIAVGGQQKAGVAWGVGWTPQQQQNAGSAPQQV
jgi:hypothetical protein